MEDLSAASGGQYCLDPQTCNPFCLPPTPEEPFTDTSDLGFSFVMDMQGTSHNPIAVGSTQGTQGTGMHDSYSRPYPSYSPSSFSNCSYRYGPSSTFSVAGPAPPVSLSGASSYKRHFHQVTSSCSNYGYSGMNCVSSDYSNPSRRSKRKKVNTKEIKNEKQKVRDARLRECEHETFDMAKDLLGTNFGSLDLTKCEQLEFVKTTLECMAKSKAILHLGSNEAQIVSAFFRNVEGMVQKRVDEQITKKVKTETCRKVLPQSEWCGNCLTVARKKGCLKRGRSCKL